MDRPTSYAANGAASSMSTTTTQQQQQHRSAPLLPVSTSPSLTRFTQHPSFVAIKRRSFKHVRADSHSAAVRTLSVRFSSTSELLLPVGSDASPLDDSGDTLISGELGRTSVSINLIKCAVGAGSFSLPAAFLHSGFWAGIILCCFLGLLAAATIDMLAAVERRLSSVAGTRLRYPDLALLAFNDWRGRALRVACLVGVLSTSLGVCSVYVIFISSELTAVLAGSQYTTTPMDVAYMMSPFILGLALLRSFKYLVFTSILGDVAVLGGLVGTVFIGASVGIKASPFAPMSGGNHSSSMNGTTASLEHLPAVNWATLPEAAGSIAFLFLIHVVILPMSQSMKGETAEEQRRGFRCVTGTSYFFITTLNAAFGAICVCLFGLETKGNVLTNIAESGVYPSLVLVIRILLCVDLLFTIPMVLAAGREIVEDVVVETNCGRRHTGAVRNVTRIALIMVVYLIVAVVPNFEAAVSLVGGFANSLMGLILPPLLMYYVLTPQGSWCRWTGMVSISLLGGVLLVTSTWFTIKGF